MNDTPAIERRFRVGRFIVTFSVPTPALGQTTLTLVCEWNPHLPASLTARELRQYAAGRDRAVADLTEAMLSSATAQGLLMGDPDPLAEDSTETRSAMH